VTGEFEYETYINFESALEKNEIEILPSDNEIAVNAGDGQSQLKSSPNSTALDYLALGSIKPNAKVLNFKSSKSYNFTLNEFHDGFAIVDDSGLPALIDPKGNEVIKLKPNTHVDNSANGYFATFDNSSSYSYGLINYKGEVIVPLTNKFVSSVDDQGYFFVEINLDATEIRNINGGKCKVIDLERVELKGAYWYYKYVYHAWEFSDGLRSFSFESAGGGGNVYGQVSEPKPKYKLRKKGFVNQKCQVVIEPEFEEATEFSEGLAAVGKLNEVNELKWGFINTKGELIIPFMYSNKPGPFKNGLAHVKSKADEDAWIDTNGKVKIRMSDMPTKSIYNNQNEYDFVNPVVEIIEKNNAGKTELLKIDGTTQSFPEYVTRKEDGTFVKKSSGLRIEKSIKGQMIISAGYRLLGLADEIGNIIVQPVFSNIGFFDSKSGLAKATFQKNKNEEIEGYINREGVFVIVKGKPSSEW
jgi:hypothetical protein